MFVFFKFPDCSICFILHTAGSNEEKGFDLMKQGIKELVDKCGVRSVNYCVISNKHGEAFQPVTFQRRFEKGSSLVQEISALEVEMKHAALDEHVLEAEKVFKGQTNRKKVCS